MAEEEKKKTKSTVKEKSYIMKVTHLSWGLENKNHFYSERKPLITKKAMGRYAGTLDIWLKAGWIEEGKY